MEPDFINRILIGDCRRILPSLPEGFFDCAVTSPPYWRLRDYGSLFQVGREPSIDEYVDVLSGIFAMVKRTLKPEGSLWINMADQYVKKDLAAIPWKLVFSLKEQGWILRNTLIWHKSNPLPASVKDRLNQDYEYVFHFVQKPDYYYNLDSVRIPHKTADLFTNPRINRDAAASHKHNKKSSCFLHNPRRQPGHPDSRAFHPLGKNPGCIINLPSEKSSSHPAAYPAELCRLPVLTTCPEKGIVLDPFAGSGSTLRMAEKLGRNFTGIEINSNYIDNRFESDLTKCVKD